MNQNNIQSHCFLSPDLAERLVEEFGTPLYVYDRTTIEQTVRSISSSVSYARTRFHYACVTNGNPELIGLYRDCGWGLHANTPGDVFLAQRSGYDGCDIVYSGSNLTDSDMRYLLETRVGTINLDSEPQLHSFCTVYEAFKAEHGGIPPKLGLRLNLPEITGATRIGVRPESLMQCARHAQKFGLAITGVHFYRGTGTNSNERYREAIDRVLSAASLLPQWEFVDFGGGFGFSYNDALRGFDWRKFGSQVSAALNALDRPVQLIIEPGRSAIAGAGILVARVVSAKWLDGRQIVGVDTSVSNLSVLSVHGGYRRIVPLVGSEADSNYEPHVFDSDVCGNTTFSRDYLGKKCMLPKLNAGDLVAILDSGAYGFAMTSHFLHRPKPAEVLISDSSWRLIRRRETYEDLVRNLPGTVPRSLPRSEAGSRST